MYQTKFHKIFALTLAFHILCLDASAAAQASPDLVVHLLDYLAKDYGGAVQDGEVINRSEYTEQIEFIGIVDKASKQVQELRTNAAFTSDVTKLSSLVAQRASPQDVSELARHLQQEAIRLTGIDVAPSRWPVLEVGAKLFEQNCTTCHGPTGKGDGPAGAGLDPAPANFHNPDLALNSAPYMYFNTIRLGVPGTGMPPFSNLSDAEVWALAFFLKALPFETYGKSGNKPANFSLREVAVLTDSEIMGRLDGNESDKLATIASIRSIAGELDENPLQKARGLLERSLESAKTKDFPSAENFALRAYLEGVEPIEPKLRANVPGTAEEIEARMSEYRSWLSRGIFSNELVEAKNRVIDKLDEAQKALATTRMSPNIAFGATFSIFLREGFEAVLIIVILISVLRSMGQIAAIKWVHVGWLSAVACGIAAWIASGYLIEMSSLNREVLEGAIAIMAVLVLIYVGHWLHRHAEVRKWRVFLEDKVKQGADKGGFAVFALIAFAAVFREAFEIVIFLRAIWMDLDATGQSFAGIGVLTSFGCLLVFSYLAVLQSRKLPIGMLFRACSWLLIALAVMLAGKGIHSLQEAGLVPIWNTTMLLRMDLFGIYPSVQTLGFQFIVIAVFTTLYIYDNRRQHA